MPAAKSVLWAVSLASSALAMPAQLEAEMAGGLTTLVSPGDGEGNVELPADTHIASVSLRTTSAYVALLLSGPDNFYYLRTPDLTYPLVLDEGFQLSKGLYNVYVASEAGTSTAIDIDFSGLDGSSTISLLEGKSTAASLQRAPVDIGEVADNLPVQLRTGSFSIDRPSVLVVTDGWRITGVGGSVTATWHKASSDENGGDCRPLNVGAFVSAWGSLRVASTSFFPASAGEWTVGASLYAPGSMLVEYHDAFAVAVSLRLDDPLHSYEHPFWSSIFEILPTGEEEEATIQSSICALT